MTRPLTRIEMYAELVQRLYKENDGLRRELRAAKAERCPNLEMSPDGIHFCDKLNKLMAKLVDNTANEVERLRARVKELEAELIELRDPRDQSVMREFCGWLSADMPELHGVEVPRLADSLERFLKHQ